MSEDDWQLMKRLAESRYGEQRDSRQIMAAMVIKHESDIAELKKVISERDIPHMVVRYSQ